MIKFDRNQHVFHSPDFEEIIKDTIRFFNGTPVLPIPAPERFHGTGVYAVYCTAQAGTYKEFHKINRTAYNVPIYAGKAVPKGWRQSRSGNSADTKNYELNNRIREHGKNLQSGEGLEKEDFRCRFIILEGAESDLIGTVEAALIRNYKPSGTPLLTASATMIRAAEDMNRRCPTGMSVIQVGYGRRSVGENTVTENSW